MTACMTVSFIDDKSTMEGASQAQNFKNLLNSKSGSGIGESKRLLRKSSLLQSEFNAISTGSFIKNIAPVDQDIIKSGAKLNTIYFTNNMSASERTNLYRKAIENQERVFQSNYRKALNPMRKVPRDDEQSVQLVRYLERINNEIQLISSQLDTRCRENVRLSYQNPKTA